MNFQSTRRRRSLPAPATLAFLALLVGGCAGAPKASSVPEENAQQRALQQTISQLRKNMDEIRQQRDEVQEQYYKAEGELETAHRELAFLESRVRVERELGDARDAQLGDLQNRFLQTTSELRQARERIGKLDREQTTIRAAFDQDQLKVAQLESEAIALAGEIESLKAKLAAGNEAWELERRTLRDGLQAREDEISVLTEKLAKSESEARAALASGAGRVSGGAASSVAGASPNSPTIARTTPPAPAGEPAARAEGGDVGGEEPAAPLWERKAKEALSIAFARFGTFLEDPAANWRELAHPAPILFVFFAGVMPLILFFSARRRLRRRSLRKHAAQVAQAAQAAHDAAPAHATAPPARHARPMPSVAIPRRREVIPTMASPSPARSAESISPQTAGSVAATLDAVLGGDPIADPAPRRPAGSDDEDDLLGDLRDIVQKGLS